MKNFRTFLMMLALVGLSVGANAQNYQTVNSTVTTTFIGNDNQQAESIRIDSSFVYLGDSIFYPFYNIQQSDYNCYLPFSYSWIGKKVIIQPDGYNYFINRENDTIKMNTLAQLNENWIAYEVSDIIIMAEVIKEDTLSFLGQIDSAKTISFTAYNQNMDPISHPVNNMTIIISKNYGMLKTMNFGLFPNGTSRYQGLQTYNLIGMSSPPIGLVNLTWKEIYDFEIGDEFYIVYESTNTDYEFYKTKKQEIYVYLEKTMFSDSVIYRVDREIIEEKMVVINNIPTTEYQYIHDTITTTYKADPYLEKLSGEIIGDENYSLSEVIIRMEEIPIKIFPSYFEIQKTWGNEEDSCWIDVIIDGCIPAYNYLKGLGGPYHNCAYFLDHSYRELRYYKKGDKTWGTPLSINDVKDYNDNVKIYPNPAADILYLQSSVEVENVHIYDVCGRLVKRIENPQIAIIVSDLSKGFYFLKVKTTEKESVYKIVKQ